MQEVLRALAATVWALSLGTGLQAAHHPKPSGPSAIDSGWPKERVELVDGGSRFGLVESVDDHWLYLTEIRQPAGRPMYLLVRPIERSAVASVERLDGPERERLKQRIAQYVSRARIEEGRMEAVPLGEIQREGGPFRSYHGKWFDLDSGADEETTRRVVVRLEQMFTAYRQVLAPRTEPRRPLRVLVFPSMHAYQQHLKRYGLAIQNPAVFLEKENLVVAGSEVGGYAAQLAKLKEQNASLRQELGQLRAGLPRRLGELGQKLREQGMPRAEIPIILNKERATIEGEINQKLAQVQRVERRNAEIFDSVTRQMLARLYHEAFHAYLENYVFPRADYDVPLWLNEGLAMIFEAGILESDTLRIDAPARPALELLKTEIRQGRYLALSDLLAAGPKDFLQPAGAAPERPDRHYAYAWGLAYYLTFEKDLLAGPALEKYVAPGTARDDPAGRFERLVGVPLARFQADWHEYLLGLR